MLLKALLDEPLILELCLLETLFKLDELLTLELFLLLLEAVTFELDFFDDETENGKLYINYPMVESLKYTKQIPDNEFYNYIATREDCANHKFKSMAETFAYSKAKAYRFIDLNKTEEAEVAANWELLKGQNVKKANYIVNDIMDFPISKDAISQEHIFNAQKTKFVRPSESVSILNSFPIFLYDYFK